MLMYMLRPIFLSSALLSTQSVLANTVLVTNNQDQGEGSLRAAIEAANVDASISRIQFKNNVGTVLVEQSLHYSGTQAIAINGRGSVLKAKADSQFDLLAITQSQDIQLTQLSLVGSGGNGLFVSVPVDSQDLVIVDLNAVNVIDNGLHGIFIDDQNDIDKQLGSAASIHFSLTKGVIQGNGVAQSDFDGIRIDEGGIGEITVQLTQVDVLANGGDGVEFDETGAGDVNLTVFNSQFIDNGFQDINDLEDGIDIDEAGSGDVNSTIINTIVRDSRDEGIDFDEEGEGDVNVRLTKVTVINSADEGIKFDEEDEGSVRVQVIRSTVLANNDDGLQLEETNDGDLDVKIISSTFKTNAKFAAKVEQGGAGQGHLTLINNTFVDNADGTVDVEGVEVKTR